MCGSVPKLPKGKVGLYIVIDEELNKKLREIISLKYRGFSKGLLSREVEEALAYWVRLHTHEHTKLAVNSTVNPHPKVYDVFKQVQEYFRRKYKYLPQQVTYRDLEEAISAIRGSDKRTIRKWIGLFLKWKCIKMITPNIYELV